MRSVSSQWSRRCAVWLALGRVAVGVAAVARPDLPARPWVGSTEAGGAAGRVLGRALGGRDISLGLGALLALRHDRPVGPAVSWVAGGALADGVDALATVVSWCALPPGGRVAVTAVAGSAAILGTLAATTLSARAAGSSRTAATASLIDAAWSPNRSAR